MANPVQARGLELVQCPGSYVVIPVTIPASSSVVIGINDPVKLTGLAADGRFTVVRASAGGGIHGVILNPRLDTWGYMDTDRRRTASVLTSMSMMKCDVGDGKIFRIQASTDADFAVANFSTTFFCDLDTVADASALTAYSTVEVNLNTAHATDGDLKVLGLDTSFGGENTIAARAKMLVQISNT